MSERVWDTRQAPEPAFERDWLACLARSPHANFTLDPAYLAWEARRGAGALAVLAEAPDRTAAFVLRREGPSFASGWPWRWQAVIRDASPASLVGMAEDEAAWIVALATRIAGGRQVRCFLPVRPPSAIAGFCAGMTVLYRIDRCDEELLQSMNPSKRRMVRRARQSGYEVVEATTPHQFSVFAQIQRETKRRHRLAAGPPLALEPDPGHSWREWELPWMWLLVAVKDGRVESGLGDGVRPAGVLEGRAGGSTLQGRRDGAFALLSYEEARLGRDRGHRLVNLGGDTVFKREIAGRLAERVGMWCWLGGHRGWDLASQAEVLVRAARRKTLTLVRRLRSGRTREVVGGLLAPLAWWTEVAFELARTIAGLPGSVA